MVTENGPVVTRHRGSDKGVITKEEPVRVVLGDGPALSRHRGGGHTSVYMP